MCGMQHIVVEGKTVSYDDRTRFEIHTGRNAKSSYVKMEEFTGLDSGARALEMFYQTRERRRLLKDGEVILTAGISKPVEDKYDPCGSF